jgi:hypothetical protein
VRRADNVVAIATHLEALIVNNDQYDVSVGGENDGPAEASQQQARRTEQVAKRHGTIPQDGERLRAMNTVFTSACHHTKVSLSLAFSPLPAPDHSPMQ